MIRRDFLRVGGVALGGTSLLGAAGARTARQEGAYEPLARLRVPGTTEAVVSDDGETAFLAVSDGYACVDVSEPEAPTLLAERRELLADREDGPLGQIHDVKVDGDTLLAAGPAHPHSGAFNALVVVDVSDPASPERRGVLETQFPIHNCFLDGEYAYLTGNDFEENPLVVADVSGEPTTVGRWSVVDRDPDWLDVAPALRVLHDVYVRDDVAYLAYWDAGTWLLDVSDPTAPSYVSHVADYEPADLADLEGDAVRSESHAPPGNSHYAAPADDGSVLGVGRESWAVNPDGGRRGGPSGIDLYDVSDPSNPRKLTMIDPPASPEPTHDGVWTTAHNFEFRGDRLYSSWYRGGVKVHDVSDPARPRLLAAWRDPDVASFWTAQAAVPGEFFVASSMWLRGGEPGLWTFPDRPGEQADPPPLGEGESAENGAGTPTETEGPTATPYHDPAATSTANETAANETTANGTPEGGEGTEDGSPGFGFSTGAAGIAAGAYWLRRRRE